MSRQAHPRGLQLPKHEAQPIARGRCLEYLLQERRGRLAQLRRALWRYWRSLRRYWRSIARGSTDPFAAANLGEHGELGERIAESCASSLGGVRRVHPRLAAGAERAAVEQAEHAEQVELVWPCGRGPEARRHLVRQEAELLRRHAALNAARPPEAQRETPRLASELLSLLPHESPIASSLRTTAAATARIKNNSRWL